MFRYRVSGLSVVSEIDLPGLIPDEGMQEPHVTIRGGQVPLELDGVEARGPNWERASGRFLLDIPHIARFLLEDGRSILFEATAGVDDDDLAVFLSGSAFGILLHQREQIVLHASAVMVGGKAVLFCGPSGVGKSTLAAALGERGYGLAADDQCAVSIDAAGTPVIHPDGRMMRLWSKSIEELNLAARRGAGMRKRLEKFYVAPREASERPLVVGAIYSLAELRPSRVGGIAQPNIVDAARLLIANAYRPMIVRRLDQVEHYFRTGAVIANAAGIFTLTRERGFKLVDATMDLLEQHWQQIGLLDDAA